MAVYVPISHFFIKLVLAAPESGLPSELTVLLAHLSAMHFFINELLAAPAIIGEMNEIGNRGVYCSDYHCSHWIVISEDRRPDDVRLFNLEPLAGLQGAELGRSLRGTKSTIVGGCVNRA